MGGIDWGKIGSAPEVAAENQPIDVSLYEVKGEPAAPDPPPNFAGQTISIIGMGVVL